MTQIATALATGTADAVVDSLGQQIRDKLPGQPKLLVAFASTKQPLAEVCGPLKARFPDTVVLGASSAGEFTEAGDAKESCVLWGLEGDYHVHAGIGEGLAADPEAAIESALSGVPREVHGYPHCTAVLMLDPLAGNGEEVTLLTASKLGPKVKLAGGAAGDDLQMKKTLVSHGAHAASDALVLALIFSRQPLGVGVSHGHKALSGELEVTQAEGATIKRINGRPAWDVWREETKAAAAARDIDVNALTPEAEGGYLLRYEAGLEADSALKVRAPLSRGEDGSINLACAVPEGAVIRITESTPERQVASAREAAKKARAQLGEGQAVAGALVFDCICRNLILGDGFANAVRGMSEELDHAPLAGFETYGEIALDVGEFSGFHNTTSVVLVFPR